MKKLIVGLLLLLTVSVITLVSSSDITRKKNSNDMSHKKAEFKNGNKSLQDDNERLKDIEYDAISFSLNLIDWRTNEIVKKIKFEKNELIFQTFKLNQGYAIIDFIAEKPIEIITNQDGDKTIHVPNKFVRKVLRIYDVKLNLLKEVNLERVFPKLMQSKMWAADVSQDGNIIAWSSRQNLYIYNVKSDSLIKVFEETNPKSLEFYAIRLDKEGKNIVYYGNTPKDGEISMSYGIVEITDGNIINFHEKNYMNPSKINVVNQFACITDRIDGWTQTSSGRILILDLVDMKAVPMEVDGFESTFARISGDGKFLIAANENINGHVRVRQYRLGSDTIVKEEKYLPHSKKFSMKKVVEGKNSSSYYFLGVGNDNNKEFFEFVCKEE